MISRFLARKTIGSRFFAAEAEAKVKPFSLAKAAPSPPDAQQPAPPKPQSAKTEYSSTHG